MPVLPGADIRGFYAALAIHLPPQAEGNACVRCFASPDAHRREDRNPSLSVRLSDGVWKCHGCGARGGPYDAAWVQGLSKRSAMDLMVAYGLAERRPRDREPRRRRAAGARPTPARAVQRVQRATAIASPAQLRVGEHDVARWQTALAARQGLLSRLARERAWRDQAMRELELGFDRGRITIPIRGGRGQLRGVLRYKPNGSPKMVAVEGTRLGLVPHPAAEASEDVLLVEGPPDMIAARSHGLPAIAVPGDHSWRPEWAQLLAGRRVSVVMDADGPGRELAERIASDLDDVVDEVLPIDLAPERDDGYDLTDWLLEHQVPMTLKQLHALA
ncbi:MAG TPA: hypothetical protein VG275_01915 [Solirubrobacteraceae bacterium]|nr:hypothetical protein [Solirubrobacteraceae bacterium]